jgi:oligosaccharide repeat unit polymerase
VIVPLYGLAVGVDHIFMNNVRYYIPEALYIYSIGILFFFIGYFIKRSIKPVELHRTINGNVLAAYARLLFICSLIGAFAWAYFSGYGIGSLIFSGEHAEYDTIYAVSTGGFNYFKSMIDWCFAGFVLSIISNMKLKEKILWVTIFSIIFISIGVRYRLLYLLLTFVTTYVLIERSIKLNVKRIMLISSVVLFLLASVHFRGDLRRYSLGIQSHVFSDYYEKTTAYRIYESLDNYMTFASVIKYMDNGYVEYDYGESIVIQLFIRMIPKYFFDGKKPDVYTLKVMRESFGNSEALSAGKAATNIAEYYIMLGVLGVVIFMFTIGLLVSYFNKLLSKNTSEYKFTAIIMLYISMYHLTSRGYFVGYLMHLSFLMAPIALLKIIEPYKKKMVY